MIPKIISVGFSTPEQSYSQREIFEALNYPRHFWRLFRNSGIDKRHFWVPLERLTKLSWQEQAEGYIRGAIELSKESIINCLDGRDPKEIGCLVYGSCTGLAPGPTIPHYLMRLLSFSPSTYVTNIIGQGCESGFPNLKRAYDFAMATGKLALVVNCELCSLTYFPEPDGRPDPENRFELARANAIFADAATSALVGFDNDQRHPYIVDTETYTDTQYLDDLGYVWRDGRLRVLLSPRVPEIAAKLVGIVIPRLLGRHNLKSADITHWIIHAAGSSVLDNIRDTLGLSEEKAALSRETLRLFGNTSSTSVGITGALLMQKGESPEGYGVVISLGPGMTAGATMLQWGK